MNVRDELKNMSFQYFDDGVFYIDKYIRDILSRFIIVPKESARVIECDKIGDCCECPILHSSGTCPVDDFTQNTNRVRKIIIIETPNRKG